MRKHILLKSFFLFFMLLVYTGRPAQAATPLIKNVMPYDCYYHYDGKIWVYGKSAYKLVIKAAIKKLNSKYHIFKWTSKMNCSDVIIADKKKKKGLYGLTRTDLGKIVLFRNNMKKLSRARQILVVEHELCHAAGIDHSKTPKSLMHRTPMKTRGLTAADLKALKKARKRALKNLKNSKAVYNAFISAEKEGQTIQIDTSQGNSDLLIFPKRGTSYSSSNKSVLQISRNGLMTAHSKGTAVVTANNNGTKHTFTIKVK